jgi:prepilin peptidase CpaA
MFAETLNPQTLATVALLVPLTVIISYYDVRYRRIPNAFVLATLGGGLLINGVCGGLLGLAASVKGLLLAFVLMLVFHVFGAMGAGDVKLFAAIGSVLGSHLVLPTFLTVVLVGGALAFYTIVRSRIFVFTMQRVLQIFVGLLPGWQMPRFAVPSDRRHTIPYGVAITFGSLISLFVFRA